MFFVRVQVLYSKDLVHVLLIMDLCFKKTKLSQYFANYLLSRRFISKYSFKCIFQCFTLAFERVEIDRYSKYLKKRII